MSKLELPKQERLNNILSYDPETGNLYWKFREDRKKNWNTTYANKIAGCVYLNNMGARYVSIRIDNKIYLAHRVIWKMVNGKDPDCIDHLNGDGTDNRISNIVSTSLKNNQRNKKMHRNNSSGYCGVFRDKIRNKWLSWNSDTRKHKRFDRLEDAIAFRKVYVESSGSFTKRHGT